MTYQIINSYGIRGNNKVYNNPMAAIRAYNKIADHRKGEGWAVYELETNKKICPHPENKKDWVYLD